MSPTSYIFNYSSHLKKIFPKSMQFCSMKARTTFVYLIHCQNTSWNVVLLNNYLWCELMNLGETKIQIISINLP